MNFQIKNRFTDAVMFTCELPPDVAAQSGAQQLGWAIKAALKARANLADAYLADADLAGADLTGAYLAGAYLAGADLAGANLAGAYLARAYLAGADLAGAYLAGADLTGAYLARAYLADADLTNARNVPDTNGSESIQEPAASRAERYAKRAAKFRERNPDVPVIPDIDARLLGILERQEGTLNMNAWHTCRTTHCMAGWAVTLAGPKGKELEEQYGPHRAGHMIYTASIGQTPHFFASDEQALIDLRVRAAEQAAIKS